MVVQQVGGHSRLVGQRSLWATRVGGSFGGPCPLAPLAVCREARLAFVWVLQENVSTCSCVAGPMVWVPGVFRRARAGVAYPVAGFLARPPKGAGPGLDQDWLARARVRRSLRESLVGRERAAVWSPDRAVQSGECE